MPDQDRTPPIGVAEELAPGVRRIIAPNPSPMTHWGTNTYLLGRREVTVIDPGPDLPAHLGAIDAALEPGARITQVLVTHAHLDHSPLAPVLAVRHGARVLAYGDAAAGRSPQMQALARTAEIGGGEGVDTGFVPDAALADGAGVTLEDGRSLTALWTPGHMGNHLSFVLDDVVFTGDLVMGWASTLISPPDGDVGDFLASCRRLAALTPARLFPGHGAPVEAPAERIAWLIAHREAREAAILAALSDAPRDIASLTAEVYADTPTALRPAAERNVLAHLVELTRKGEVHADPLPAPSAHFTRVRW